MKQNGEDVLCPRCEGECNEPGATHVLVPLGLLINISEHLQELAEEPHMDIWKLMTLHKGMSDDLEKAWNKALHP